MESRTRNIYIISILIIWVVFVAVLLVISSYMSSYRIAQLEQKSVVENSHRAMSVMHTNLQLVYLNNLDNAYWDETYNYIKTRNNEFITKNITSDLFKDNKMNFVAFLNRSGNVVWARLYDSNKKNFIDTPKELLDFLKENSAAILKKRENYNNVVNKPEGFASFLKMPDSNDIMYFAVNYISDTTGTVIPNGYAIFGKFISPDFFKQLSEELSYKIYLTPISEFNKTTEGKMIADTLKSNDTVYHKKLNQNTMVTFAPIKDINFNTIGIVQIDIPRTIYKENQQSSFQNRILLISFAMLGMIGISYLVYSFFKKQEQITLSFERFVPHQFLELLQKKSVLDVKLGNNTMQNLSVLFMDIRNFTTISEGLTPQQNFDFINTILKEVSPLITKNHGFIDKYIGDAIMALFPNENTHADNTIAAAMMILDEIDKINYTEEVSSINLKSPVKVGIGINTGSSILGVLGAEGRLESTVISDTVNTASRLQTLTKTYTCDVIISEQTYKAMKHPDLYIITYIDDVVVKGKNLKIPIYKVEKRHY